MATNAWPRCEKCGHEIASDTDWCRCPENAALHRSDPTPDLAAICARLAIIRGKHIASERMGVCWSCTHIWPCDTAEALAAFDAQATRLAAVEQALRSIAGKANIAGDPNCWRFAAMAEAALKGAHHD